MGVLIWNTPLYSKLKHIESITVHVLKDLNGCYTILVSLIMYCLLHKLTFVYTLYGFYIAGECNLLRERFYITRNLTRHNWFYTYTEGCLYDSYWYKYIAGAIHQSHGSIVEVITVQSNKFHYLTTTSLFTRSLDFCFREGAGGSL